MPNYDFICDECETEREVFIPITQTETVLCKACNSEMRKTIKPTPAIFRGNGWANKK